MRLVWLWIARRYAMADLPTGTVTFLFTDIEGSTRLWEQHPQAMAGALVRHDAILRQAIADEAGVVYKVIGDAFSASSASPPAPRPPPTRSRKGWPHRPTHDQLPHPSGLIPAQT